MLINVSPNKNYMSKYTFYIWLFYTFYIENLILVSNVMQVLLHQ